jgi:hypothetical protein
MKLSRQIEKPFVSFFFHQCSEHVSSYDIACIYVATLSQILVMVGVSFKLLTNLYSENLLMDD